MAREFAQIRLAMLSDAKFRNLSESAQWLYMVLLAVPSLSYAGVADWRPNRIAGYSRTSTAESVMVAAAELSENHFVVVAEEFEEVLIRSFLKYDGVMKQPRLAVSMANAYGNIMSETLRSVVVFELQELKEAHPDWQSWDKAQVADLLTHSSKDAKTLAPYLPPVSVEFGAGLGETLQSLSVPPTTTTATTTETSNSLPGRRKPELPISESWAPNASAIAYAKANNLDVLREAEQFTGHALTHDRRVRNWDMAFRTWLGNAKPIKPVVKNADAWMNQ